MKKVFILLLIVSIILIGCEAKNENNIANIENLNVESSEIVNNTNGRDVSKMSFEERTKEARDFINQDNGYGIPVLYGNKASVQHYVDFASLKKEESYYVMKLEFFTPMIYEKEEIEKAYDLAQKNGTAEFEDYTFYKDNLISLPDEELNESAKYDSNNMEGLIIATKEGETNWYYTFMKTPNDNNKYFVMWEEIYFSDIVYDYEGEMEVILLSDDKMTITQDRDLVDTVGEELTVEEYYTKAINNTIASGDLISGYEFSLDSIGSSILPWEVTNAVNFDNGSINVSYHNGGI